MSFQPRLSRRQVLQLVTTSGLTFLFGWKGFSSAKKLSYERGFDLSKFGPFEPSPEDTIKREFLGDQFQRVHPYIWNPDQALKIPDIRERHKVVIVGGGLSGLFTAYCLRDLKPVVLEQASRLGGNAKGQIWKGIRYGMGSAYITLPAANTPLRGVYREIGLEKFYKFKSGFEPVAIDGNVDAEYWYKINERRPQMKRIDQLIENINQGQGDILYPDIGGQEDATENTKKLDQLTFKEFLEEKLGEPIHPELLTQLDFYCLGSFNATSDEVSAAAGLNFYCSENAMCILPGGNATLAEQLIKNINPSGGLQNFYTNEIVLRVEVNPMQVQIYSLNLITQKIRLIESDVAIMACPKFVVAKILKGIEPQREQAIRSLKYRSYLVANLLLNKKIRPDFYEILMVKSQELANKISGKNFRRATDIVHGSFAGAANDNCTVISMYRPMAYEGGRRELINSGAYDKFRAEFEAQIRNDVMPILKIHPKEIVDLRITQWGHAMPIAEPKLIANGICQTLRKPFRDRVFFVEQDNWALPCVETGATEALFWAPQIRSKLR